MTDWIGAHATALGERALADMQALVAISSPGGDHAAAERAVALARELAPPEADVERIPCSSPGHADDLVLRLRGTGAARIVLVGHLDTVVAHDAHKAVAPDPRDPDRLVGSGTVDMKGGDALALGTVRALVDRREDFAEVALLLVCDEEFRLERFAHVERFAGYDACLCYEGGERTADGDEAVVVRRKAAGAFRVRATGRSAHSGSKPDDGRNALLALAAAAQVVAGRHDPAGPDRVSAVPTMMRAGAAINVVPGSGELVCDVRADRLAAIDGVRDAVPSEHEGVRLDVEDMRRWPGMDARDAAAGILERASAALGAPVIAAERGGASDASHFGGAIEVIIDGLGPIGGDAHNPGEWVAQSSFGRRAEVALAVVDAVLAARPATV